MIAPYEVEKLEVLSRSTQRARLMDLLGTEAKKRLEHANRYIEYSEEEIEMRRESGDLVSVTPYWDEQLRQDPEARFDLCQRLRGIGMGTLRKKIRGRVSFFSVTTRGLPGGEFPYAAGTARRPRGARRFVEARLQRGVVGGRGVQRRARRAHRRP